MKTHWVVSAETDLGEDFIAALSCLCDGRFRGPRSI